MMTDEVIYTDYEPGTSMNPEEAQLESFISDMGMAEADANSLRALTRLLIGGALVGWEELFAHLRSWEEQVEQARVEGMTNPEIIDDRPMEDIPSLRYAVIGLLFEGQEQLYRRSKRALNLAGQVTSAFWSPLVQKANKSRQLDPARDRYTELVRRGETVTKRWVERGQDEEDRSRQLARIVVQKSFDTSMEQLGQAPALEQLVRRQSAGLTQSAMDEARARTVSGDLIAEHYVRSLFRRKPRRDLEEPRPMDDPDFETDSE